VYIVRIGDGCGEAPELALEVADGAGDEVQAESVTTASTAAARHNMP
jgi:hypothetical protein